MYIIWHGQSFFEFALKSADNGETIVVIDPFKKETGLRQIKVSADVLLISHPETDAKAVAGKPFLIDSPGEYEAKGALIKGIALNENLIVYKLELENIKIVHLSLINQKELSDEQLEALGGVDVLLIPTGGKETIDGKTAANIVSQIEPRIVIPMHYQIPKLKEKLDNADKFLKQMGAEGISPEKKLKLTPKLLPQEETKIIVLEP